MFCPRCGSDTFRSLHGGNCSIQCVVCGAPLNCYDPISEMIVEESIPINDLNEAIRLKRKFNQ